MSKIKVIVCGGRDFDDYKLLENTLDRLYADKEIQVVSGHAAGADILGEMYAKKFGLELKKFPAKWSKFGAMAGPVRNAEMADYANHCVAFWDGKSSGTRNMIKTAKQRGLIVHIVTYIK